MYINSAREICLGQFFMPLFFSCNGTDRDKASASSEKLASNNKENKPENKSSINGEELAHNNNRDLDNKYKANMKIFIVEKNIYQDSNASVQEQKKAKIADVVSERPVSSNFYLFGYTNSKSRALIYVLDL